MNTVGMKHITPIPLEEAAEMYRLVQEHREAVNVEYKELTERLAKVSKQKLLFDEQNDEAAYRLHISAMHAGGREYDKVKPDDMCLIPCLDDGDRSKIGWVNKYILLLTEKELCFHRAYNALRQRGVNQGDEQLELLVNQFIVKEYGV